MKVRLTPALVIVFVISLSVIFFIVFFNQSKSVLPEDIQKKANFNIYALDKDDKIFTIDKKSINYDGKNNILLFTINGGGINTVITQQATPESFSVVQGGYQKLLESMRQYKEVKTRLGTVTLTKPEELRDQQIVVANPPGTLIFARPDKQLNDSWIQQLFDSLMLLR